MSTILRNYQRSTRSLHLGCEPISAPCLSVIQSPKSIARHLLWPPAGLNWAMSTEMKVCPLPLLRVRGNLCLTIRGLAVDSRHPSLGSPNPPLIPLLLSQSRVGGRVLRRHQDVPPELGGSVSQPKSLYIFGGGVQGHMDTELGNPRSGE